MKHIYALFLLPILLFSNAWAQTLITLQYGTSNQAADYPVTKTEGFSIKFGDLTKLSPDAIRDILKNTHFTWKSGAANNTKTLQEFIDFVPKLSSGAAVDNGLVSGQGIITFKSLGNLDTKSITLTPALGAGTTPLPISIMFTESLTFDATDFQTGDYSEKYYTDTLKLPNLVVYYPGQFPGMPSHWKVYRNGKPRKAFWYKGTGNTGRSSAVLLIDNFNMAMYTISASNSFVNYTSSLPSIFSTVSTALSTPAVGASKGELSPPPITAKTQSSLITFDNFITLNTYMRQMLLYTKGDFRSRKNALIVWVNKQFPNGINADYQSFIIQNSGGKIVTPPSGGTGTNSTQNPAQAGGGAYQSVIIQNSGGKVVTQATGSSGATPTPVQAGSTTVTPAPGGAGAAATPSATATPPSMTSDDFKTKLFTQYHIIPDSLIKQDVQLYTLIQNTSFTYEYDVIQLQNVDQIQFTVNITPTAGSNGGATNPGIINTVNQTLNIPVLGGLKFDFSTGFYYSSVRNENYALYDPTPATPGTPLSIVKENNFKGGVAGVSGLIHVYYPFVESWVPDLCAGVGTSTALNYSFLAGGGLMFTVAGQNKISISSGYNISSIKTLSNGELDGNGNPVSVPSTTTAISYSSNFKHGWFLSLTYNFGLSKATQSASNSSAAAATPTAGAAATPSAAGATGAASGGTGKGGH